MSKEEIVGIVKETLKENVKISVKTERTYSNGIDMIITLCYGEDVICVCSEYINSASH